MCAGARAIGWVDEAPEKPEQCPASSSQPGDPSGISIHTSRSASFKRVFAPGMCQTYLRADLGMPRGGHPLMEGQHAPARVLALFSKVLAHKQPDYPPQTIVTGFPFYDAASEVTIDPALQAFLGGGEPPIVFTLGSSAVWIAEDFYETSIAVAQKLGRRALLLAGKTAPALRERVPETIGVFDYAPHSLVMPRASVIVHQGGVGSDGR